MSVKHPELPMMDIQLVFNAGSARDGDRPGLAQLTHTLLDKGADGLSANQIAEQLEGVGARLGGDSLRHMATLNLRSLSDAKYLQPAVAVFAKLVAQPDFNADDLNRERERMLIGLQYAQQQPEAVSEKAFYAALYGTHPYASPPEGTVESLKSLDRAAVQAFHKRYYVARNAVVAIVAAVDRATAEKLAATVTAGLAAGAAAPAFPAVADFTAAGEIVNACVHGFGQIDVLVNCATIARGGQLWETSEEDSDAVLAVTLKGTLNTCHHALRAMMKRHRTHRLSSG